MTTDLPARIVVEDDRVILRGAYFAGKVIRNVGFSGDEGWDEFCELFEIVEGPGGTWLAAEDYYQGLTAMALIRRKSDGRLFGYPYWDDISSHGSSYHQANGYAHGFGDEWDEVLSDADLQSVYVWLPVEPFTITGYRIPEAKAVEVAR
jgi:hypothetical protein